MLQRYGAFNNSEEDETEGKRSQTVNVVSLLSKCGWPVLQLTVIVFQLGKNGAIHTADRFRPCATPNPNSNPNPNPNPN